MTRPKEKTLLIDDEPDILTMMAQVLVSEGHISRNRSRLKNCNRPPVRLSPKYTKPKRSPIGVCRPVALSIVYEVLHG